MTEDANKIPPSRIPTPAELKTFSHQTEALLLKCIKELDSVSKLDEKIRLGLLVKLLKVYRNMFAIADLDDSDTPPILARIIYELALSFIFLVINQDDHPEYYELFKKTTLQRMADLMKVAEKAPDKDRKSNKEMVEGLKKKLSDEQFNLSQSSSGYPKSWLPDKSYYQMAKEVGDEFLAAYNIFYEATSIFVHPNWLDIEGNHLDTSKMLATAQLKSPPLSVLPLCTASCFVLRTIEVFGISIVGKNAVKSKRFVERSRHIHHLLHNGSPDPIIWTP